MSYYDLNAIAAKEVLENSHQYQLTITSAFKILETGVHAYDMNFVVRLIRNFVYENGNPYVLYVNMSKYEFDQIMRQANYISDLLRHKINKTVFQTANVHAWTQCSQKNDPSKPALLCVRGFDGTRIYITQGTFNRLFSCTNFVDSAYDRFTSDSNCSEQSSDYDDSDDCYYSS